MAEHYKALGIMSGSSLDGVDMALCEFVRNEGIWSFNMIKAITCPYSEEWKITLRSLPGKSHEEITKTDLEYGRFLGELVNEFLFDCYEKPELIASHGHTIFHEPEKGYTLQIGDGQTIATVTGITTINNFRSKDIELGGQGAPLVPIGDQLLFAGYDFCLNIGGIANISFESDGKRLAFDVCPANQLLNYLSLQLGAQFDDNGFFAGLGKLNTELFDLLNADPYYKRETPKSLSNQYVIDSFIPKIEKADLTVEDKLYTVVKHIAFQVNRAVSRFPAGKMLITGGGAHNGFLVKAIELETKHTIVIPETEIIDFKEAVIFALMGVLRLRNEVNCLASVTGARKDSSCGVIFRP
ncbi:MAG: anhydro-N-acetylmuramic acid kinase [Chlorobi bacterium]|nr:anhydro-N-acetylmuramic acid kinase [Chlorobiota bacterium]